MSVCRYCNKRRITKTTPAIAQGLHFSNAKDLSEIPNRVGSAGYNRLTKTRMHSIESNGAISSEVQQPLTTPNNHIFHILYRQEIMCCLSNSSNSYDLERRSRSLTYRKPFQMWFLVQLHSTWQALNWRSVSRGYSAIAELLVLLPVKFRIYTK